MMKSIFNLIYQNTVNRQRAPDNGTTNVDSGGGETAQNRSHLDGRSLVHGQPVGRGCGSERSKIGLEYNGKANDNQRCANDNVDIQQRKQPDNFLYVRCHAKSDVKVQNESEVIGQTKINVKGQDGSEDGTAASTPSDGDSISSESILSESTVSQMTVDDTEDGSNYSGSEKRDSIISGQSQMLDSISEINTGRLSPGSTSTTTGQMQSNKSYSNTEDKLEGLQMKEKTCRLDASGIHNNTSKDKTMKLSCKTSKPTQGCHANSDVCITDCLEEMCQVLSIDTDGVQSAQGNNAGVVDPDWNRFIKLKAVDNKSDNGLSVTNDKNVPEKGSKEDVDVVDLDVGVVNLHGSKCMKPKIVDDKSDNSPPVINDKNAPEKDSKEDTDVDAGVVDPDWNKCMKLKMVDSNAENGLSVTNFNDLTENNTKKDVASELVIKEPAVMNNTSQRSNGKVTVKENQGSSKTSAGFAQAIGAFDTDLKDHNSQRSIELVQDVESANTELKGPNVEENALEAFDTELKGSDYHGKAVDAFDTKIKEHEFQGKAAEGYDTEQKGCDFQETAEESFKTIIKRPDFQGKAVEDFDTEPKGPIFHGKAVEAFDTKIKEKVAVNKFDTELKRPIFQGRAVEAFDTKTKEKVAVNKFDTELKRPIFQGKAVEAFDTKLKGPGCQVKVKKETVETEMKGPDSQGKAGIEIQSHWGKVHKGLVIAALKTKSCVNGSCKSSGSKKIKTVRFEEGIGQPEQIEFDVDRPPCETLFSVGGSNKKAICERESNANLDVECETMPVRNKDTDSFQDNQTEDVQSQDGSEVTDLNVKCETISAQDEHTDCLQDNQAENMHFQDEVSVKDNDFSNASCLFEDDATDESSEYEELRVTCHQEFIYHINHDGAGLPKVNPLFHVSKLLNCNLRR